MSDFFKKNCVRRALRTFFQTAIGYLAVNVAVVDFNADGQALKAAGLVENGVDAKYAIQDGLVLVNGNTELQRGKKLYSGDIVSFEGETIMISN